MGRPFARVGITGYPESHPKIDDDITIQSMWDKRRHAAYLVSNLCFDPATLRRWITRVRARGVTLPLLVGPGRPGGPGPAAADGGGGRGAPSRPGSWPGTPSGSSGSVCPAATARSGCWTGSAVRSPTRPQPSRDCTSSRSTSSVRPRSGAGSCWRSPRPDPVGAFTVPWLRCLVGAVAAAPPRRRGSLINACLPVPACQPCHPRVSLPIGWLVLAWPASGAAG